MFETEFLSFKNFKPCVAHCAPLHPCLIIRANDREMAGSKNVTPPPPNYQSFQPNFHPVTVNCWKRSRTRRERCMFNNLSWAVNPSADVFSSLSFFWYLSLSLSLTLSLCVFIRSMRSRSKIAGGHRNAFQCLCRPKVCKQMLKNMERKYRQTVSCGLNLILKD